MVLSPNGQVIREIQLIEENPMNITFGGINNKHCFVTIADRGYFKDFLADHLGRIF